MCGRFALAVEKHIIEMLFQLELRGEFNCRYNIAPSQEILAVRVSPLHGGREPVMLKWGLVPHWARDESIGARLINARSETAAEKPAFREALKKRRILIPASGFYEWKSEPAGKQPYLIGLKGGRPFVMAGLWESRRRDDGRLESCTIMTTRANSMVGEIHSRMPVIVPEEAYAAWLDPQAGRSELEALTAAPYPAEMMTVRPVSRLVNNPANDHAGLIAPLA